MFALLYYSTVCKCYRKSGYSRNFVRIISFQATVLCSTYKVRIIFWLSHEKYKAGEKKVLNLALIFICKFGSIFYIVFGSSGSSDLRIFFLLLSIEWIHCFILLDCYDNMATCWS